ncbi:hypothetical protein P691DRAFT_779055 [Macrolepiota fuliginosa MF-IS2]|uniref:GST N-terminal domain-containing protein n=1 Tax=Macrolepiota fuliginosa MF-IS2 TaxID=1400762 RepID=A0A9P5X5C6_9AGAR|nr:hypothetical protein P691DRAFT_779055 [Macrolepiota fuliginosa MF-IS2]
MITLYDVASKYPRGQTWSPNVWRVRYILDFKGIPYTIVPVEYYDIESTLKGAGIGTTGRRNDGSDLYTVPAIVDPKTGAKVSDSIKIALYLEESYPDTPSLFPHNTSALHQAFFSNFYSSIAPIWVTIVPRIPLVLSERASVWFIDLRSKTLGKPLNQTDPVGEPRKELFRKTREVFATFDGFYEKNGGGQFIMGNTPGFADLMIAAAIQGLKVWGEDSSEWRDFCTWDRGRWTQLLEAVVRCTGDQNE